jgi:3-hydroxyisobutyrate dehydrogenase
MGSPMCMHVLDAGYEVDVFNRTPLRAAPLIERGARWRASPAAVAADVDVLFTMLGYPADVRSVLLGEGRALHELKPRALLVDLTTSEPLLAEEIHALASSKEVEALDAPVSGGDVGARSGELTVMVGGTSEAFERARPLLETFGRAIQLQGGPGAGQHTKMANQIAIASGMIGVCEALLYAFRSGLDCERVLVTLTAGAAGSWSLTNYGPRLLAGDLEPGFKVDHFIKDLGVALAESRRMNLALPGLALAERLYLGARDFDLGQKGTHSLLVALARMSDIEWPVTRR